MSHITGAPTLTGRQQARAHPRADAPTYVFLSRSIRGYQTEDLRHNPPAAWRHRHRPPANACVCSQAGGAGGAATGPAGIIVLYMLHILYAISCLPGRCQPAGLGLCPCSFLQLTCISGYAPAHRGEQSAARAYARAHTPASPHGASRALACEHAPTDSPSSHSQ
jgi:hypothetical protein